MLNKLYSKLGLELDDKDNVVTVFAKGGLQGTIEFALKAIPVFTTIVLIGRCVTNKGQLEKFEEEMDKELGA